MTINFGIGGSGLAMHRPGVHEIRMLGPVGPRLDMPILRGCDICVFAPVLVHIIRDTFGDRIASCTPSSPPSQNVGCTSTTIKALAMLLPS